MFVPALKGPIGLMGPPGATGEDGDTVSGGVLMKLLQL